MFRFIVYAINSKSGVLLLASTMRTSRKLKSELPDYVISYIFSKLISKMFFVEFNVSIWKLL